MIFFWFIDFDNFLICKLYKVCWCFFHHNKIENGNGDSSPLEGAKTSTAQTESSNIRGAMEKPAICEGAKKRQHDSAFCFKLQSLETSWWLPNWMTITAVCMENVQKRQGKWKKPTAKSETGLKISGEKRQPVIKIWPPLGRCCQLKTH